MTKEPEEPVWDADQWLLNRLKNYKITRGEFCALWDKQGGRCLICFTDTNGFPQVDHCHVTGQVRGLLCRQCNTGLGMFSERADMLLRAAMYVALCDGYLSPQETEPQERRNEIVECLNRPRKETYEVQDIENFQKAMARRKEWGEALFREGDPECT